MDATEPATYEERAAIVQMLEACPGEGPDVDLFGLLGLIRLERELGVEAYRPGLLAATWCIEASMRHGPLFGDRRGGKPMALGPFQLWPGHRKACGLTDSDAQDLEASARCYAARVLRVLPRAASKCPDAPERTAEAAVANVARYRWSCVASSKHWQLAERMTGGQSEVEARSE
jgi:hypothetical protein